MTNQVDILQKIIHRKQEEVTLRRQQQPLKNLEAALNSCEKTRGFVAAIAERVGKKQSAVIAEVKKASPSKGVLREDFDPAMIAKSYAEHGATCLSVLTDIDFFQGSDRNLQLAKAACNLPILRKDFMVDPYQIIESRVLGADCILLIAAALNDQKLKELYELAQELTLDVLIEVHDAEELQRILPLNSTLVGINNRNLRTFEISLQNTIDLLPIIPQNRIVVTESGIHTPKDVALMHQHGVYTFLVGESFMRADNPGAKLQELFE